MPTTDARRGKFQSSFTIGEEGAKFAGTTNSQDAFAPRPGFHRPPACKPTMSSVANGADVHLVNERPKNLVDPQLTADYAQTRSESRRRPGQPPCDFDWKTGSRYDGDLCRTNYTVTVGPNVAASRKEALPPPRPLVSQYLPPVNTLSGEPRRLPCPPFEHPHNASTRITLDTLARREQRTRK
jgi:hypothetical protein